MVIKKKILILSIILLSILMSLFFYKDQMRSLILGERTIINIYGKKGDIKVSPENPEGTIFPGVDLNVYSVLDENEKILPKTEFLEDVNRQELSEDASIINNSTINDINTDEIKYEYFLQLGSFTERNQAEKLKRQLEENKHENLSKLNYKIAFIDIQNRGIFYRLLAGPIKSEELAVDICDSIKKDDLSCFPIKEFINQNE